MSNRHPMPPVVRRLGWVSFLTDAAGELLYPLIPIFLTVTLGAPVAVLGLIEGLADGVSTGLRAVAGALADRFHRNRLLITIGYGLSAVAKPLLAVAPGWGAVAALRVGDRVGKGIRGAPRDVMIAEAVDPAERGRAFGFHRTMDTAGAVVGPLLALGALAIVGQHRLRPVFALALIPGLGSLLLLSRLPKSTAATGKRWEPGRLPWRGPYGRMVLVMAVFGIGNSSDAFLLLRAKDLGLSTYAVIAAYALFNLVYAALSLPAGIRADRIGKAKVYGSGLVVFAVVYLGFAVAPGGWAVWPLFAVYGAFMALTEGVARALVVDLAPDPVRGKALGVSQAVGGGCALVAGVTAGILWDAISPAAPFVLGAVTAVVAAGLLAVSAGASGTTTTSAPRPSTV